MDGTGLLFKPLIELLPPDIKTQIICFNSISYKSNEELVHSIERQLNNEVCVILSESYSGFIAHELCSRASLNIKHVIYAASFLINPSKLTYIRKLFPLSLVCYRLIPKWILKSILFGNNASNSLIELFLAAIDQVPNKILKQRLNDIHKMQPEIKISSPPATYVQASNDYLVRKCAVKDFEKLCLNLEIVNADGGHFIVQSNPQIFVELLMNLSD